eukprot:jgi/Chlat1/8577/Chrsp82S07965
MAAAAVAGAGLASSLSLRRCVVRTACICLSRQRQQAMCKFVPACLASGLSAGSTKAQEEHGAAASRLVITKPDDWHLHLRDGDAMRSVVPHSAAQFQRAIIMPNLRPPVISVKDASAYRERILAAVPAGQDFQPLMTLYLTDNTPPDEVQAAKESGFIAAFKLYPAGATTNSAAGVTSLKKCEATLAAMQELNIPLLVHGEVTDPAVDVFDREKVFIEKVLSPVLEKFTALRVVMEHITTKEAANFVQYGPDTLAATITPQHLLLSRNALFQGGIRPHYYCLPILKRETHRQALLQAVASGSEKFFLGTDSAPHERSTKEAPCGCAGVYSAHAALQLYAMAFEEANALDKLETFASFNGPDFYGLPRNEGTATLEKIPMSVPQTYTFADGTVVPFFAGETVPWSLTG